MLEESTFDAQYLKSYGDILDRDPLIELIKSHSSDNSVIYDIGASHGAYSIYLAYKISNSKVYSFEPLPYSYQELIDNIAAFDLTDNIFAQNIAISNKKGAKEFFWSSDYARSSLNQQNALGNNNEIIQRIKVKCSTIDHLVKSGGLPTPDIIKIDVEGHEYEVFKGAKQVIKKSKPKIFFEPHEIVKDKSGQLISSSIIIKDFLSKYGYNFKSFGYPIMCY
jgi:FkbM family methyltransferase